MRIVRLSNEAFLWVLALGLYVAALLVRHHLGDSLGCDLLASTSNYGDPSWSWLPPGTSCTYTVGDGSTFTTFTVGPGGWTYVAPVLLVCWAISLRRRKAFTRSDFIEDELQSPGR